MNEKGSTDRPVKWFIVIKGNLKMIYIVLSEVAGRKTDNTENYKKESQLEWLIRHTVYPGRLIFL